VNVSILSNLFNRDSKYITGVDIGSGFIKVAQLDYSQSQPALIAAGATALPPGAITDGLISNSALLATQLQQLMLSAGCHGENVAFSVGGRSTFVREVLFPSMEPAELKEAITWDIEKYIPFAPDTYYYDYSIVGKSETDLEMRVLIAAAPKEEIDALMALANESGLKPIAIDIDALAAGRALGDPDSALLVDIGDSITQITVFQGGCPVAARTVVMGGRNFTFDIMQILGLTYQEAELLKVRQEGLLRPRNDDDDATDVHSKLAQSVGELAREIVQTSEFYKVQNRSAVIDKVILTGGGANLDNLIKHLEWQTGMPVALLDPLFSVRSTAAFDPQYIRGLGGQLTVAIGLAMRGGEA
jgi:type IV pilus assembly protein PilM